MSASLISPSGKVLVRRARCSLQPAPDPLAMPVLVSQCADLDTASRQSAAGQHQSSRQGEEAAPPRQQSVGLGCP